MTVDDQPVDPAQQRQHPYRITYEIVQYGDAVVVAPTATDAVTHVQYLLGVTPTEQFQVVAITSLDG